MVIREVSLLSRDLAATRAFDAEVLLLPVLLESAQCVTFRVGDTVLTFHHAPAPAAPFYHLAFSIPHNQAVDAQAWMARRVPLAAGGVCSG